MVILSDAGSGYKSMQHILHLRSSFIDTGINVRHYHFNASGEGKRSETDGHGTAIKTRREVAMRAGIPKEGCVTAGKEVEAQCFITDLKGSHPCLLEFDCNGMDDVDSGTIKDVLKQHDFIFEPNGDIIGFRTFGVGTGK